MAANVVTGRIQSNDRVGALGQTGSGKTFLMLRLLSRIEDQNVIVVDTKGSIRLYGYKIVREQVKAAKGGKVIYRPRDRTAPHPDFYTLLWQRFGGTSKPALTLYIDEAAHVTGPNTIPDGLRLLVQAGREVGIGVWWGGQQSTRVNNTLISQSEYIFVFKLARKSDRQKLEQDVGATVMGAVDLPPYHYYAFGFPEIEGIQSDEGIETYVLKIADNSAARRRVAT